jgi:hypothetical protein
MPKDGIRLDVADKKPVKEASTILGICIASFRRAAHFEEALCIQNSD